jgi:acetyl esterase/lipase
VDCQWIALSKDWQEAKRKRKEQEAVQRQDSLSRKDKGPATDAAAEKPTEGQPESGYTAEMDEMRCMLYFHGGGYYFGSIDQERYLVPLNISLFADSWLDISYSAMPER